ncbi:hypothetical protein CNMCM5793_003545 [Aspergillus hiratsukae]|uniref:Cytochrome P450 n=1 Tax=Aspergillus hiratsukae TaxID=1194566 RepID=A0A8H6PE55_9EURO|nr:hypothetical protein CNMCM5793_003545 [Aspergillus hiratsukae]
MLDAVVGTAILLVAALLYERLYYLRIKQYADWPQPKPSILWGHLKFLSEVQRRGDERRHFDYVLAETRASLGNPPVFLLDLRPFHAPMGVVCDHELAEQMTKSSKSHPYGLGKAPALFKLAPLLGKKSIITAQGTEWKSIRKRFSPGFSSSHLMTRLPEIMHRTWRFVENIEALARSGEEFLLHDLCANLTFDIIGAVAMGVDLRAQLAGQQSEIVSLFRQLTAAYRRDSSVASLWAGPGRYFRRRQIAHRLDRVLDAVVEQKFREMQAGGSSPSRSVLSISLEEADELTPELLSETRDQLKTFLFAGYETTSNLLQWAFYELSRTPHALQALRRELKDVFGPDAIPSTIRDLLSTQGSKYLPQLVYTGAVLKEVLRLYPATGSAGYPLPGTGFFLHPPQGAPLRLDGIVGYNFIYDIQRDESVYGPTKDDFIPERWLAEPEPHGNATANTPRASAIDIPPGAWRPFERGPRACIGQELAKLEARAILVCSLARYDFEKVGMGQPARDRNGNCMLDSKGQYRVESELFNVSQVTAVPVDGMKMRVKLADVDN